jgi:hypothetical protein
MSQRSSSRTRSRALADGVGETCRGAAPRRPLPAASWSALLVGVSLAVAACVPREREGGQVAAKKSDPVKVEPESATEVTEVAKALPVVKSSELPSVDADEEDPPLGASFVDDFERPELGPDWRATSPAWRISGGKLCVANAKNHPIWLKRRLPLNGQVEFDAVSSSPDGDIKAEIWGDGRSAAAGTSYNDATSYVAIFGGWRNSFHVLARLDEHASDRKQSELVADTDDFRRMRVSAGKVYHFKLERRDGKTVRWLVDDVEILSYDDSRPLAGEGHEHFGFNNWQVRVCFDNLRASPVKG